MRVVDHVHLGWQTGADRERFHDIVQFLYSPIRRLGAETESTSDARSRRCSDPEQRREPAGRPDDHGATDPPR